MDKDILEVALKRFTRDYSIQQVVEVESAPALAKGENYSSAIERVRLKVVLGNGRILKRTLILKKVHTEEKAGQWMKENEVAKAEAQIYSVIHKEMTYLMQEFNDTNETLWCQFLHYDPESSSLLMEDLKASGYKLVPRQKGLDMEHSTLALEGLGRYHGMAKVLEKRGVISKDCYKPSMWFRDPKLLKSFLYNSTQWFSRSVKDNWRPSWEAIVDKFSIPFAEFEEKIKKMRDIGECDFTVLNHGDCWSNNIMFKYDWQERPTYVKFVDYQVPNYGPACLDVTNFFYLSIQPHVRRNNYSLLLHSYHDSLIRTLDTFGYTGRKPPFEDITASMDRLSFLGMSMFIGFYPLIVTDLKDALDTNKALADDRSAFNTNVVKEPGLEEKMEPDIIDYVKQYFK